MCTVSYVLVWLAQPGLGVGLVCRYCILDMDIFYIHFICLGGLCIYYTRLLKCTGLACSAGSESESGAFGKDCLCIARAA